MRLSALLTAGAGVPEADFSGRVAEVHARACLVEQADETLLTLLAAELGSQPCGITLSAPFGFSFSTMLARGARLTARARVLRFAGGALVVVACGGGIPVVRDADGRLRGVEAVIDKDLASSLLARAIGADLLGLATGVERVAIGFNTPRQRWLDRMTLAEARGYDAAEEFDKGSMGPKIKALIEFTESTGKRGLITSPASLCRALQGETGTMLVPWPEMSGAGGTAFGVRQSRRVPTGAGG